MQIEFLGTGGAITIPNDGFNIIFAYDTMLIKIAFDVTIFFPWDMEKQKFAGERVHVFGLDELLRGD